MLVAKYDPLTRKILDVFEKPKTDHIIEVSADAKIGDDVIDRILNPELAACLAKTLEMNAWFNAHREEHEALWRK